MSRKGREERGERQGRKPPERGDENRAARDKPADEPKVAGVELILEKGVDFKPVSRQVNDIVKSELNSINDFTKRLTEGKIQVC